jgi:glycosyltransferase involved in cell wall biosynthesis
LETYSKIPKRNLVLISNYNSFEYGKQLKEKYTGFPNLFLQDAVYNIAELDVIRSNAQLYIHSHSFCGTAPSLVEAMNLNLPVIAFDVPTNHFTTEDKALYFKNEEELFDLLQNINQEKLSELAKKMRDIASRRYSWEMISQKYADLF